VRSSNGGNRSTVHLKADTSVLHGGCRAARFLAMGRKPPPFAAVVWPGGGQSDGFLDFRFFIFPIGQGVFKG